MNKRPRDDRNGGHAHHKKHKHEHDPRASEHGSGGRPYGAHQTSQPSTSYESAIASLPPPTATGPPLGHVPAYTPFTVTSGLPPLPTVGDGDLSAAPFRHKSSTSYNRSASTPAGVTYDQLEFLGDAQIEHIASRLLYQRLPHLLAGQQSQLRELLVKNETLAEYAKAYGFDRRVQVGDMDRMLQDSKDRGNKGFMKVLADVFEAYVAAVVLSHGDDGFAVAEKWMTALWAPKLLEAVQRERFYTPGLQLQHAADADPLTVYNPSAKAELQKRILAGPGAKLEYEPYQQPVELKGAQLGQNRHYIAVYLTGYGHERKLLGKGEGRNKVEAGNWAATQAMYGESKGIVDECAAKLQTIREEKRKEREAKDGAEKEAAGEKR